MNPQQECTCGCPVGRFPHNPRNFSKHFCPQMCAPTTQKMRETSEQKSCKSLWKKKKKIPNHKKKSLKRWCGRKSNSCFCLEGQERFLFFSGIQSSKQLLHSQCIEKSLNFLSNFSFVLQLEENKNESAYVVSISIADQFLQDKTDQTLKSWTYCVWQPIYIIGCTGRSDGCRRNHAGVAVCWLSVHSLTVWAVSSVSRSIYVYGL